MLHSTSIYPQILMNTQITLQQPLAPRPIKSSAPKHSLVQVDRNQPLTRKQLLFIEYYLRGMNAKRAAEQAGYSPTTCEVAATSVLKHPAVVKEIRRRRDEIFDDEKVDTKWILNRAYQLANSNIMDVIEVQDDGTFRVDLKNVTRDMAVVIRSLSYDPDGRPKVELVDPKGMIELLAKIYKVLGSDRDPLGDEEGSRPLTRESLDELVKKVTVNQQINITVQNDRPGNGAGEHYSRVIEARQ